MPGEKFFLSICVSLLLITSCQVEKQTVPQKSVAAEKEETIVLPSQQAAIDQLNEGIAKDAENDSLYYERAKFHLDSGDTENGFYDLYKAIQINPKVKEYYVTGALFFIVENDLKSAIGLVDDGLRQLPNDPVLNLEMAKLNLYIRKYEKTEEHLAKALIGDPSFKEAYIYGAISSKEQGKMDEAIRTLEKVVNIDPDYYEGLFLLGEYHKKTDRKIALQYYRNALRVDPNSVETLYAIALMYQELEKFPEAKKTYRDILLKEKQNEDAFYNIGYIYLQQDSFELAKKHFQMAIGVSPVSARCYYMRGYSAEKMGDVEQARRDYNQALVFDEDLKIAKNALARIDK